MGKTATKICNNFISMTVKRRKVSRSIKSNKSDDDNDDDNNNNNNNNNNKLTFL
jgi:hypothetical protein